ncbi:DUF2975 domain-containing protein [Maribacter arcticus]|nr:DUF2975 domain-containing protein [Maribacter arcticus]MDA9089880.1 DUF2975 domain-containing protein [Maribacter arcticus]
MHIPQLRSRLGIDFFEDFLVKIFEALGNGLLYYSIEIFSIILIKSGLEKVAFLKELKALKALKAYNLNVTFSELFTLIVIAIFILIISQLIKDGYELRKENDLTI